MRPTVAELERRLADLEERFDDLLMMVALLGFGASGAKKAPPDLVRLVTSELEAYLADPSDERRQAVFAATLSAFEAIR